MRSTRTFLLCLVVLALPACFKHHTVDEGNLAPSTSNDPVKGGDGDGDGDGDSKPGHGHGDGDTGGDGDEAIDGGLIPIGDGDQAGGDGDTGGNPGIPGLDCSNVDPASDPIKAALCGLVGNGNGGNGGNGGITLPTPEECANVDPQDIIKQILCGITQGGGNNGGGGFPGFGDAGSGFPGFPGGNNGGGRDSDAGFGFPGFPGGNGNGGGNNSGGNNNGGFQLPTAEECANADPNDRQLAFLCQFVTGKKP